MAVCDTAGGFPTGLNAQLRSPLPGSALDMKLSNVCLTRANRCLCEACTCACAARRAVVSPLSCVPCPNGQRSISKRIFSEQCRSSCYSCVAHDRRPALASDPVEGSAADWVFTNTHLYRSVARQPLTSCDCKMYSSSQKDLLIPRYDGAHKYRTSICCNFFILGRLSCCLLHANRCLGALN